MLKTQYWANDNNFGDALNPYIQKAFNITAQCRPAEYADLVGIGSSMERLLMGSLSKNHISASPIFVWTTGFHFPVGAHKWYDKITVPETFARTVKIKALRGKLSKARAEKILQTSLPEVILGDGGLLANRVFMGSNVKKYRLGIVAHMSERHHPVFKQIQSNIKNSVILNIFDPPDKFIKKLTQCEALLSTALHPLIVADSYRIPNMWINLSKDTKISMYKFSDYYSIYDLQAQAFDLTQKEFTEKELLSLRNNYTISDQCIAEIQEQLIAAHPFSQKIRHLSDIEIQKLNAQRFKRFCYRLIPFSKLRRRLRKPNAIIE